MRISKAAADKANQVADATAFPAGSMIYQCNAVGTPIGYALAMGKSALYYAKGAVSTNRSSIMTISQMRVMTLTCQL